MYRRLQLKRMFFNVFRICIRPSSIRDLYVLSINNLILRLTIDAKCKDEVENNESLTKQNKNLDEQVKSLTKQLSDALDQLEALKLAQIEKNGKPI